MSPYRPPEGACFKQDRPGPTAEPRTPAAPVQGPQGPAGTAAGPRRRRRPGSSPHSPSCLSEPCLGQAGRRAGGPEGWRVSAEVTPVRPGRWAPGSAGLGGGGAPPRHLASLATLLTRSGRASADRWCGQQGVGRLLIEEHTCVPVPQEREGRGSGAVGPEHSVSRAEEEGVAPLQARQGGEAAGALVRGVRVRGSFGRAGPVLPVSWQRILWGPWPVLGGRGAGPKAGRPGCGRALPQITLPGLSPPSCAHVTLGK